MHTTHSDCSLSIYKYYSLIIYYTHMHAVRCRSHGAWSGAISDCTYIVNTYLYILLTPFRICDY